MNIVLLGHRDIASNVALSLLITAMPQHKYVVMLSGPLPSTISPALAELSDFEQALCDELATAGSPRDRGVYSFAEIERRTAGAIQLLERPNSPDGLAQLSACRPDLVISVRYRRILKNEAIAIPQFGVLNLHSGLLPDYKGVMATFWALLNGESTIGSTAHWIVDGTIDTGPVIGRSEVVAEPGRSYLSNVLALYPAGCRLLVEAVNRIDRGETVSGVSQEQAGRYYSVPTVDVVARFQKAGLRLFDGNELQEFLTRTA